MAFDLYEKAYMNNLKSTLTEDQWEQYLGLTRAQQKTQLTNRIDTDIANIDIAIARLEADKIQRESALNEQKTRLNNLKTNVGAL